MNENDELVESISWELKGYQTIWGFADERNNIYSDNDNHADEFSSTYHCSDLSIRVPYKAGEIVLVDMSPFIAPFPAVIIEAEWDDYTDCCQPQIAYINHNGMIGTGALKHLPHRSPRFSPLLRLERYKHTLEGKDEPLQIISEIVGKNPKKGEQLNDLVRDEESDRPGKRRGLSWNYLKDSFWMED